jgi:hypothetical protein
VQTLTSGVKPQVCPLKSSTSVSYQLWKTRTSRSQKQSRASGCDQGSALRPTSDHPAAKAEPSALAAAARARDAAAEAQRRARPELGQVEQRSLLCRASLGSVPPEDQVQDSSSPLRSTYIRT